MSESRGKKKKHRDGANDPDTPNHELSGSSIVTGDKVKKKKRMIAGLAVVYAGSGDAEETPKRKKRQNSETELVTPTPKRKKTGHTDIEEQTDQEREETSTKKKKRKEDSRQEADDLTADDASSPVLHRERNKKVKKSHKAKDSKKLLGDEVVTEGAPCSEFTDLEGRSKKKKKKLKKASGEHLLEDDLLEESLTPESQHATKKKKKQKGGGGLEEEERNWQHGFTEKLASERECPDGSETPEQVDERVKKKKKKKREDESQEDGDITAGDEKIKISCKAKDLKRLHVDEGSPEEASYREPADIEPRPRLKKKKHKKDGREHILEDSLGEESLTSDIQHTSKKKTKRKGGGDESHRQDCFTRELLTKKKHQGGSGTIKQVLESADQAEDSLVEQMVIPETQHAYKKKKKRKDGGGLQEEDDENNLPHGFTNELISKRNYADSSETPEQVDERVKKKKKIRKDPSREDEENNKKSRKAKDLKGLQGDEGLPEEPLYREPTDLEPRLKKKPKKEGRRHNLEDSLVEESSIPESQHTSKKKKTKRKDGEDESHRQDGCTWEPVTKRKPQGGSENTQEMDESVDQAEALFFPETQHTYKKKKKNKGGRCSQEVGFSGEISTHKKFPQQVGESVKQEETPVKKKKKKRRWDELPQKTDDATVNDASSSAGLPGEQPSDGKITDTEDGPRRKKKSKKDHRRPPLEDDLVEEPWNSDAQHTSKKKKTKRKDGGGENHRQRSFEEQLVKYQGDHETTEQMDKTVEDQAEVGMKKKKKKRDKHSDSREETSDILTEGTRLEGDDAPAESARSRTVESEGNMEGDVEDTEPTSSPQTSAPTDALQNPATQDEEPETIQKEGDNRSAPSDKDAEKAPVRRGKRPISFVREKDVALLREYFPHMTERKLSSLITYHELERIRMAKHNGIMFRRGQFTIDEDELIKQNVQTFMSQVGIDSAELLFHPYKFPDKKKTIEELKKKFHFRQRIAEGLHRTVNDVFDRGVKLHQLSTNTGRYSQEEVQRLKKYCEIYGNSWNIIGPLLNRTFYSSQLKASQMRREVTLGSWSVEEMNRLIAAVKEFVLASLRKQTNNDEDLVTVPKENLYKGISWVKIEEKVETRNWTHCKRKWFELLLKRMNDFINPFNGTLGTLSSIKMITWMHDTKVQEFGDMKWDELSNFIGNVPPFLTQNRFVLLKKTIQDWKKMRLYEIVDCLYNEMLPKLEEKLSAAQESPLEPEKKDEFLISDIFQDYNEFEDNWDLPEYVAELGRGKGPRRGAQ